MVCPLRVGLAAVSAFIAAFLIYTTWDAAHKPRSDSQTSDEETHKQVAVLSEERVSSACLQLWLREACPGSQEARAEVARWQAAGGLRVWQVLGGCHQILMTTRHPYAPLLGRSAFTACWEATPAALPPLPGLGVPARTTGSCCSCSRSFMSYVSFWKSSAGHALWVLLRGHSLMRAIFVSMLCSRLPL